MPGCLKYDDESFSPATKLNSYKFGGTALACLGERASLCRDSILSWPILSGIITFILIHILCSWRLITSSMFWSIRLDIPVIHQIYLYVIGSIIPAYIKRRCRWWHWRVKLYDLCPISTSTREQACVVFLAWNARCQHISTHGSENTLC